MQHDVVVGYEIKICRVDMQELILPCPMIKRLKDMFHSTLFRKENTMASLYLVTKRRRSHQQQGAC